MVTKRERTPKPGNGQGESGLLSLHFDLGDETEREAYEMAKQLAKPHGRRKHVFVALLYGLSLYQKRTGVQLNADVVMGMALSGNLIGGGGVVEPVPSVPTRPGTLDEAPLVVASTSKADAEKVSQNFVNTLGSFGGLFD
jgi:hypothetical protein